MEDQEVNALVGYKDEMDLTAMRDTITPLDSEGNAEAEIERNGNTIDQVTYALFFSGWREDCIRPEPEKRATVW